MKILRVLVYVFALASALALNAKLIEPENDENNAKGDAAFARKDWAAAVMYYSAALTKVHYVTTYINRASAYIGLGRYNEAIADYDKAILMSNDEIGSDRRLRYIIYNRAVAYLESKQYEKAIGDFTYIITRTERSLDPYLGRGYCQLQLGRMKEARHDTQVALKVSPRNARANIQMIRLERKAGDTAAARQQLATMVALMDKTASASSYQEGAWFLASDNDSDFRDSQRAVRYATVACESTKWADSRAIETLAVAYASAGDFPNAIKWEQEYLGREGLTEAKKHEAEARLEAFQRSVPYRETD